MLRPSRQNLKGIHLSKCETTDQLSSPNHNQRKRGLHTKIPPQPSRGQQSVLHTHGEESACLTEDIMVDLDGVFAFVEDPTDVVVCNGVDA